PDRTWHKRVMVARDDVDGVAKPTENICRPLHGDTVNRVAFEHIPRDDDEVRPEVFRRVHDSSGGLQSFLTHLLRTRAHMDSFHSDLPVRSMDKSHGFTFFLTNSTMLAMEDRKSTRLN